MFLIGIKCQCSHVVGGYYIIEKILSLIYKWIVCIRVYVFLRD